MRDMAVSEKRAAPHAEVSTPCTEAQHVFYGYAHNAPNGIPPGTLCACGQKVITYKAVLEDVYSLQENQP